MRHCEIIAFKLRKFKDLDEIVEFLKKKNSKKTCYSFTWGGIIMFFSRIIYICKIN